MPALRVFWNHRLRSQWPCEVATPPRNHLNCGIVGTLTRRALREDETTMEDRSSRRRANPGDKARRGLSANEIACALISMMARSTCSNQRPNTLMQDRISQRRPKPLAPHGRTIHWVQKLKSSRRSSGVFLLKKANLFVDEPGPPVRILFAPEN